MRVLYLSLGRRDEAASRTRVYQLLPYLRRERIAYRVLPFAGAWPDPADPGRPSRSERARETLNTLRKAATVARLAPRFDVVTIQRVLLPPPLQRLTRARARRLLFDFDDAIYLPHHLQADPARQQREGERFNLMVSLADTVIAATPHLAERARPHLSPGAGLRLWHIPTPIDTDRYRPAVREDTAVGPVTIGWIGSPSTGGYLVAIRPALRQLLAEQPAVRVAVIGAPEALRGEPGVRHVAWSLDTEVAELQRFDVGVMPLPDDEWSRGKAGYKLLQYMAVGLPTVASPVGANPAIVREGETGCLATTAAEWLAALRRLVGEPELRRRLGERGRRVAEREYSVRALAPRFIHALRETAAT